MAGNLHLVFSTPPDSIRPAMYNAWYDFHVYEILRTPGYHAVRRYRVEPLAGSRAPADAAYLSAYEIGDDLAQVARDLAAERSQMDLPRWFDGIRFASWVAEADPAAPSAVLADQLVLAFATEQSAPGQDAVAPSFRLHAAPGRPQTFTRLTVREAAPEPGSVPGEHTVVAVAALGERVLAG